MKFFCFLFIFLFGNAFAAEYQIKRGDTLSDILYNNVEGRIYGKNHNLAKLIAANPQIKDPNNIEVGEIIYFPDSFRLLSSIDPNTVLYTPLAKYKKPDDSKNELLSGVQEASNDETKEIEKILNQSLVIGLRMNYESLSAVETTSNEKEISTSDMAYGVFLRWIHKWSEKFKFFIDASFSKYKFNVSSNKTLGESELSKIYAEVGMRCSYNPRHSFEIGLGMGESFLLNSNNSTELKIDKVMIPAISFSVTIFSSLLILVTD